MPNTMKKHVLDDKGNYVWKGIYKDIPFTVDNNSIDFEFPEGVRCYFSYDYPALTQKGVHQKRVWHYVFEGYVYATRLHKQQGLTTDLNEVLDKLKRLTEESYNSRGSTPARCPLTLGHI